MNLRKKMIWLTTIPILTMPAIAIVSCGSKSIENRVMDNPFVPIVAKNDDNNDDQKHDGSALIVKKGQNLIADKYWGVGRASDLKLGESEPIGIRDRIKIGQPKTEGIVPDDLWNWIPINNPLGDMTDPHAYPERFDWKEDDPYKPIVEYAYGLVDGEINRATVPYRQYTHGPKIKPSQSTFSRFHTMPGYVAKNGDNNVGFLPTKSDSKSAGFLSWQYASSGSNWKAGPIQSIAIPSAALINLGHRMGVPMLGEMLMYERSTGESERQVEIITNSGPKLDFPIAKGMIEYALYLGLDGYFFDWESTISNPKKIDEFTKAFSSYAKLGFYKDEQGITHYINNDVNKIPKYLKDARQKYDYKWRPLIISQYRFGKFAATTSFYNAGDITVTEQRTRNEDLETLWNRYHGFAIPKGNKERDPYNFAIWASNWPEDGQAKMAQVWEKYYRSGLPDGKSDQYKRVPSDSSYWLWNYNGAFDPVMDREIFSSYAGDPRYFDLPNAKGGFAISNMIQERTTIIGRKAWATTFDLGSGKGMYLNGSDDIKNSLISASENGWLNMAMQSYLPTYQFISDFYIKGKLKDFNSYFNSSTNKLDYPVQLNLNRDTDAAWFGGTSLDFKGSLPAQTKMVNQLYASNVPLAQGDQFSMIVKKNEQEIYPDFAAWTKDGKAPIAYYKNDGSEKNLQGKKVGFLWKAREDVTTGLLSKLPVHDYLSYDKESSWDFARTLTEIPYQNKQALGDTDWVKLTYDLSSLKDKSLMSFGLSFDNKSTSSLLMDQVKIGLMRYIPNDFQKPKVNLGDMTLYKLWKDNVYTYKARVKFDVDIENKKGSGHNNGEYVRYYMTFYADQNWDNTTLAWVGTNPEAHLDMMPLGAKNQNLAVYAIGNNYEVLDVQKYILDLD